MSPVWTPHNFQLEKTNDLLSHNSWALFLDPGMGKTSIVLRALLEVKKAGYEKTLVMGPLSVITTSWPDEIVKWDNFHGLKAEIWHGYDPEGIRYSTADIIIINFDYLSKMCKKCKPKDFARYYGFGGVVIDELTAFKSTKSKRFRLMQDIAEGMRFRWGLTGSPVANRLTDIFGQARILDGGQVFGKYVTHFRNKYFRPVGFGGFKYEIQSEEKLEELYTGIAKLGSRLSASDYLEMPELIENKINVVLPDPVMTAYKELERDLVTMLYDDIVTVPNKAAALNKCRQLVGGIRYGDDGVSHIVHTNKVEALERLYEELNGAQLLVFVNFRTEATLLKEKFTHASVVIGGTSVSERQRVVHDWNAGKVGMLIAHPASLGHGVNLQHGGNHLCWFSPTWDYELYDQCNRRLLRQGQQSNVHMHKLMVKGTVDTYIDRVLTTKHTNQESVFAYLKEEYENERRNLN